MHVFFVGRQSGKHHLKLTYNCEVSSSNPRHDVQPNNIVICWLS